MKCSEIGFLARKLEIRIPYDLPDMLGGDLKIATIATQGSVRAGFITTSRRGFSLIYTSLTSAFEDTLCPMRISVGLVSQRPDRCCEQGDRAARVIAVIRCFTDCCHPGILPENGYQMGKNSNIANVRSSNRAGIVSGIYRVIVCPEMMLLLTYAILAFSGCFL
jgi:hypothetical protein